MTIYLLDTDIFSDYLAEEGRMVDPAVISQRISSLAPGQVVISIVTFAEVIRGMLNLLQRMERVGKDTFGYASLSRASYGLNHLPLVEYTEAAHDYFKGFSPAVHRVGRRDCQIAAIALAHNYTVVTRNTRDFAEIPGVTYTDWTRTD